MNPANIISRLHMRVLSYIRVKRSEVRISKARKNGDVALGFGPSSINLMMADTCNSQCVMCGHDYKTCGTGDTITLKKLKQIYEHLDMSQIVDVIYGGGGEPFLNPELTDIAEWTHRNYPVIQHTVITNMMAGNETFFLKLIENRVHVLVSINAATRTTFASVAGVDYYDRVVANVQKLIALRNRANNSVDVSISMILMKRNIRELPDFIRLGHRLGVNGIKTLYVRIYPESYRIKGSGEARIGPEESLYYLQEESDKLVKEAAIEASNLGLSFNHEPLFCCSSSKEKDCCEPWKSLFINYNGDVYPCPASEILFKNKIDNGRYNSGNVFRQHISGFWNNAFWQALRKTNLSDGREEIVPECRCCGNAINWLGPDARESHILNWTNADKSTLCV